MKSLQPNSLSNETWATFWLHFKLHLESVSQVPEGKWKHFHALQRAWAGSQPLDPAVPGPSAAPPGLALPAQTPGKTFCFIQKLHSGAKAAAPPRLQSCKPFSAFHWFNWKLFIDLSWKAALPSTVIHTLLEQG